MLYIQAMAEFEETGSQRALSRFEITRYRAGDYFSVKDVVAREEPLEVRLNGSTLVRLMRLPVPGDDELLAAGFCLSEGLVSNGSQIESVRCTPGGSPAGAGEGEPRPTGVSSGGSPAMDLVEIRARLNEGAGPRPEARTVLTGAGGADLTRGFDLAGVTVESDAVFDAGVILKMPDALARRQEVFRASGGAHGAGLFDPRGNVLVVKEDVGRHNAVDKVLGYLLLSGGDPSGVGMMFSGRLSCEMVLKAARAGVPLVCSVSAPTALGVETGRRAGVTLVGFLRGEGFNVYGNPRRIGAGA